MTSIHRKQEEIIHHLYQITGHTYLLEKCGKPIIPTLFIRILHLMLTSVHEEPKRIFTYGVSTALLRMGLVVHEQVSLQEETERAVMEKRQLTILAGDFYSSLFYKTLAAKGEVEGMRFLAYTASQICEYSMKQHINGTYNPISQEEWTGNRLLTALADFFHVEQHFAWCTILTYFLQLDYCLTPHVERETLLEHIEEVGNKEIQMALFHMLAEREVFK